MIRPRAAGVALITVLLVVAIAALASSALVSSANLSIHRTTALRDSEQAWWVARGVEAWVLGILRTDATEGKYDGLDEAWAQPVDYLPVDQGFVHGRVADLQGRFNLNTLDPKYPKRVAYLEEFRRLLRNLGDVTAPPGIADAIADWIDPDQNPASMNGAEDTEYLQQVPAYRAANRPFTVVSELLALRGMTPELYQALTQGPDGALVAAYPADAQAPPKINVNTAPAAVLRALSETVDEAKLQSFIERRAEEPVRDQAGLQALITDLKWGADSSQLAFASEYFQIQGEVFVGSSRVALYSLIHRPGTGKPVILAHSAEAE